MFSYCKPTPYIFRKDLDFVILPKNITSQNARFSKLTQKYTWDNGPVRLTFFIVTNSINPTNSIKVVLKQNQIALELYFKVLMYRDAFLLIIIIIALPAVARRVLWIRCPSFCPSVLLSFCPEVLLWLAH